MAGGVGRIISFLKRLGSFAKRERGEGQPLAVSNIPGKGRGVIARRKFVAGEVIERCPVIVLDEGETIPRPLGEYTFRWAGNRDAVVLGFGSLYNHGLYPNADFLRFDSLLEIRFVAVRDIAAGEEITYDYGWDKRELAAFIA